MMSLFVAAGHAAIHHRAATRMLTLHGLFRLRRLTSTVLHR